MKKVFALVLAVLLSAAVALPASAAEDGSGVIAKKVWAPGDGVVAKTIWAPEGGEGLADSPYVPDGAPQNAPEALSLAAKIIIPVIKLYA